MRVRLEPGQTLLHYRLMERIGEGGMGVVWKAMDTALDREVAVKLLPDAFADDPERLARLEREAKAVAALNHPGIVTIHAVENTEGTRFIVMELVEGRPLSKMIPEGGLPVEQLLDLAIPLAQAVGAAHRQGVSHRDLKPGNVIVTGDGRVKVLDFGLAKVAPPENVSGDTATAATRTVTRAGTIVGTVAYMSPEQAQGRPVDARSDIFSLGVVLYEMASGRRPFQGDNTAQLITAILRDDPASLDRLRQDLPGGLARIIGRCLEKDPARRTRNAEDVARRLEELRSEAHDARGARGRPVLVGFLLAAVVAAILFIGIRFGGFGDRAPSAAHRTSAPTSRQLSQVTFGPELEQWSAWSPDGKALAYCAEESGYTKIFLRDLTTGGEKQLTRGPLDDIQPAWSPDGTTIAFVRAHSELGRLEPGDALSGEFSGGDVWLVDLESGAERKTIERAFSPAYSPDGSRIAVDASWAGPRRIWTTDRQGHNPKQVTTDTSEAVVHTLPCWSPDGSRIAFQNQERTKFDIKVVDLASGVSSWLTDDGFTDLDPVWSPTGDEVYFSSDRGGGLNIWRVELPSGEATLSPVQITTGAGKDIQPALAPDGQRLTFSVLQQNADLWRLPVDASNGRPTGPPEALLVSSREDSRGAWSPDGTMLAFNSDREGEMNLWVHSTADGGTKRVTSGPGGDYQPNWSRDGRSLAFFSARAGSTDIWTVDMDSGELRQLTDAPALDINPFHSPDGRWIAFLSDADGRLEVWIIATDGSGLRQLTTVGASGHFLVWSQDSRSVIFRAGAPGQRRTGRVLLDGGQVEWLPEISSGAHMSFSPDRSLILDARGHKTLWVHPLDGSPPRKIFEFDDRHIRVDYPKWSPDGASILFDRVAPQGGDVWLLEGLR